MTAKSTPTPTRATPRQATSRTAFSAEPPAEDDPILSFTPVPHVAPRRNSITADRQRAFIAELAACGIVTQAARAIGASLEALYKLRNRPGAEGFRAAWDAAVDRGVARMEDCALARAIEGEERMVVSAGKVLGTEVRHNEALVMFFLRQRRSTRYSAGAGWGGNLRPGNPTYERIRREVLAELEGKRGETLASLDAKLEEMRRRDLAMKAMLAEDEEAPSSSEAIGRTGTDVPGDLPE